jgi:glutaredoxin 3
MGLGASQPVSTTTTLPESDFVQRLIDENCVMIFSKTTCGFCTMAKRVFKEMEFPYNVLELNMVEGGERIAGILQEKTGIPTVPQVFVNGRCIGGGTETQALYRQGRLAELVSQCGIDSTS